MRQQPQPAVSMTACTSVPVAMFHSRMADLRRWHGQGDCYPSQAPAPAMLAAVEQAHPAAPTRTVSVMAPYTKADRYLEIVGLFLVIGRQDCFRQDAARRSGPWRRFGPWRWRLLILRQE